MMVSADGYVGGRDPEEYWHNWNEEMAAYMMGFFNQVDLFIYGRKSYEEMIQYWPQLTDDFAEVMNETPKIVHSKSLNEASWNAAIRREVNPVGIRAMKNEPGKDMVIFAGPSIVSEYAAHGLIDEYRLIVNPVLLGGGKPFFSNIRTTTQLHLKDSRVFDCGNVLLVYEPKNNHR